MGGRAVHVKKKKVGEDVYAADFETTVYDNQKETSVWSAAFVELYNENVTVLGNINDFLDYFIHLGKSSTVYFHNLKFDGNFLIYHMLLERGFKFTDKPTHKMPPNTFKCLISSKNRFYSITLKAYDYTVTFLDSVKLIPFSLRDAGKAFNTKHQKLDMEYKGFRYPNCEISPEEYLYIMNDVLCLKEILEVFYDENLTRMTIGSNCMHNFKSRWDKYEFQAMFPELKQHPCDFEGYDNWDDYVRRTYKGAWTFLLRPGTHKTGATFDVNSLYPFVMHSCSETYYPVGIPHSFKHTIPDICGKSDIVWFVHVRCRFRLKPKHLPTIQIKNSFLYNQREWITTSDIYYKGSYYQSIEKDGKVYTNKPDLYLTMWDYKLLMSHYNVYELEIIDGCWFNGELGLFDDYINYWMDRKENAKTKVERTLSKLFLNNLYGKLATSDDSSYQIPYYDEEKECINYRLVTERNKKTFSISCGSIVTARARYWTITHAQENYDCFIYADTDSLHCRDHLNVKCLEIHQTKLGAWKKESQWSSGIFIRAKTYAEFIRINDKGERVKNPRWQITCAGMPDRCKENFLATHPITDFKYGLRVKGKLMPKRIKGGVILIEGEYTLNKRAF